MVLKNFNSSVLKYEIILKVDGLFSKYQMLFWRYRVKLKGLIIVDTIIVDIIVSETFAEMTARFVGPFTLS